MKFLKTIALLALTATAFTSCDNDDNTTEEGKVKVDTYIKFEPTANGSNVSIGDGITGANGEKATLKKFKFLISDVVYTTVDGKEVALENNDAAALFDLENVSSKFVNIPFTTLPNGQYKKVSFGIGVSSEVANGGSEAQTKLYALADKDMNWAWDPNVYIFSKLEVNYNGGVKAFHVGTKAEVDRYRKVTLEFTEIGTDKSPITVSDDVTSNIHVPFHIDQILNPSGDAVKISLDATNIETSDIADNLANVFSVHHTHAAGSVVYVEDLASEVANEEAGHDHSGHDHSKEEDHATEHKDSHDTVEHSTEDHATEHSGEAHA